MRFGHSRRRGPPAWRLTGHPPGRPGQHPGPNPATTRLRGARMNLFKAAFSVSALTLLSRVTGLVREQIGAALFGTSAAMSLSICW